MKLRKITTTLEKTNEVLKYVLLFFNLIIIAGLILFALHIYNYTGEIATTIFKDIIFIVVLLALTISARGSVSYFRTTLMTTLGLFTTYGLFNYLFFNPTYFVENTSQYVEYAKIFLILGFVASIINIFILIFRSIFIIQYDVCANTNIDTLNKKDFFITFNEAIRNIGQRIPRYFTFAIGYQGVVLFVDQILNYFYDGFIVVEFLSIGIVLMLLIIAFNVFVKKFLKPQFVNLSFLIFFGIMTILSIVGATIFYIYYSENYGIIELFFTLGSSVFGLLVSLYLYLISKKKTF